MTEQCDRKTQLKALLVDFAEKHFSSDHSSQAAQLHINDGRVSELDEQLVFLTSDQEIQNFLGDINALAPSPRSRKVAEELAKHAHRLGAVLDAMYRLPPKDMEAFVQAQFLSLSTGDHKPDELHSFQYDTSSWEGMRGRVLRDLTSLERIAGSVLIRYTTQKQTRTRKVPSKPHRETSRMTHRSSVTTVIDPKPVQACCRVHFAMLDVLRPLNLSFQEVKLRELTQRVWILYREDLEIDQDALKAALMP